jgi:hypothetical protein
MKELLLLPTISLVSYLTYICIKFGIQDSISATYKIIKQKWLFTIVLWSVALPIMIVGSNPLLFFAGAGIAFVGASPRYWLKQEGTVHVIGATGGILLATLWATLSGFWWISGPFTLFVALTELKIKNKRIINLKNHTWWVEIAAFAMVLLSLFLR